MSKLCSVNFSIIYRMKPKKLKDEEGGRSIACPHKVNPLFATNGLDWSCDHLHCTINALALFMKKP